MGTLYQIVPLQEGTDYAGTNVGQVIQSVIIDNITPSWLYIPAANRYVPPLTWGVVFTAVANQQNTRCQWKTPPGQIAAATLKVGTAQVIFTDDYVAPSSGVALLTPNQPIHLATLTTITGAQIVTPPPGTNTLILTSNAAQNFSVFGETTGAQYVNPVPVNQGVLYVSIDIGADQSYLIGGPASGSAISVDASFVAQSVEVNGTVAMNIIGVAGSQASGFTPAPLPNGSYQYLPVQQRPTFFIVVNSFTLVANTGQTVVAAPGSGSEVVLRKIGISIAGAPVAASVLELGKSSGDSSLGKWSVPLPAAAYPGEQEKRFDYDDYAIGDNQPVFITATTAISISIELTYSVVTTLAWPNH